MVLKLHVVNGIGIKTWIYKGDVFDLNAKESEDASDKTQTAAKKPKQKTN